MTMVSGPHKVLPKNGAKQFRDGCTVHWQVAPNPSERKLGVRKKTFHRQAPAEAKKAEIRDQIHRGVFAADDKTTVAEWGEQWLTTAATVGIGRRGGVRTGSLGNYQGMVRQRIVPTFGHMPMTAVRPDEVRSWVATLSRQTAWQTVWVLRSMFELWVGDGRPLPRPNPVAKRLAPKPEPRRRFDPLTVAQVYAWRDAMPEHMRILVEVESITGGRVSEVLGLREEDLVWVGRDMSAVSPQQRLANAIRGATGNELCDQLARQAMLSPEDYEANPVLLRFQAQLGEPKHHGGDLAVRAPMKNRGANRDVELAQSLVETLAHHLDRFPPVGGWLFTSRSGNPISRRDYGSRLRIAAEQAGIVLPQGQLTHALRHHRVSVLREIGFSDQAIGEYIGDTAQTVQAVYGRPMPGSMHRIAVAVDEAHNGPRLRVVNG